MTWANDILSGLGAPQSQNNINKLAAWNACEGNLAGQSGLGINNPFNTTLNYGGGVSVNSAGVKRYPNIAVGVQATLQTLQAPRYALVVANLKGDGSGGTFATAVGTSGWGTSGTCIANSLGTSVANGASNPAGVQFNYAQLEAIWIQAGGNQQYMAMAAAIAMAESGGNANASNTNSNGSVDRGLWQINSSNGSGSSFDVMTNARAAVAMSGGGINWRPWCTAYSDGACGTKGGSYLGPGSPYQRYLQVGVTPDMNAPINATNAAGNTAILTSASQNAGGASSPVGCIFDPGADCSGNPVGGAIKGVLLAILTPLIQVVAGALGVAAGAAMMIFGLYEIMNSTQTGRQAERIGGKAVRGAATVVAPESRLAGARVATYERDLGQGQTRVTTVVGRRRRGRYQQRSTTSVFGTPIGNRPPSAPTSAGPPTYAPPGARQGQPAPDTRSLLRGQAASYRRP